MEGARAQVYPVQGSAALVPPYALRLSDYVTSVGERLVLNTLLADATKAELHVRFRVAILGQHVKLETKPEYLGTPVTLQGGVPLRLTNVELAEYFEADHLNFTGISKSEFLRTGTLPEGFYQFCFEVYEYNRGVKISGTICAPAWLVLNDPPIVNLPRNGEKLRPTVPQNVILQWTPRHTGSPNAAFTTEYDIKTVEVWPRDRNPNDAILTQPPIHEATTLGTTFVYGPDATQFELGRTYAFRVQARARAGAEHLDLFKNNGYSETVTFVYGDACDAPTNIVADAAATRITLDWDASPSQTGYTVRYKPKGTTDWYTAQSPISHAQLNDLQPGTTYEYQVMSTCGAFESNLGETASVTTPEIPAKVYSCGAPLENFNLNLSQPIPTLKAGDVIKAGDFDVTTTKASGANGVFSGEGTTAFPFFNEVRATVKFDAITVGRDANGEKRMVKGEMIVTGPALVPQGVQGAVDQLSQAMNAADSVLNVARWFVTPKPDPDDFVADEEVKIATTIGKVYHDVATGKIIVEESNGKQRSLPPAKNYALTDATGGGVIVSANGGTERVSAAQMDKILGRGYDLNLVFANTESSRHGIDIQKVNALAKNYEQLKQNYAVAYKAVAVGGSDPISAMLIKSGTDLSKIKFDQDGTAIDATVTSDRIVLNATAKTKGDNAPITARTMDEATKKETIVGKLNVAGYAPENLKLHLIPVNGMTVPATTSDIEKQLNAIYSQAVVSWSVTVDADLKVEGLASPFDNGNSGITSTYTRDMRTVINAYLTGTKLENDSYYLFFVPRGVNAGENGYMPRSKQCGFIFLDPEQSESPNAQLIRTLAHELGHGAFTLEHTFAEYPALGVGTTDNLMDYTNASVGTSGSSTTLWKYQWDVIHRNRIVLGLFEGDEAGANYNCPYHWFSSSKECESVGKILELIKSQAAAAKKITVNSPVSADRADLVAENITVDETNYRSISVVNRVAKNKPVTFDARYYEDINGNFMLESGKTQHQSGFAYYVDSAMRVKILVEPDTLKKFLKVYLFGASFTEVLEFMKSVEDNSATAAQIKNIRKFIRSLNDTTAQKGFYVDLQKKVQYHNQRDNKSVQDESGSVIAIGANAGDVMCNLTSEAMALDYLGILNPGAPMQFEDYLETLKRETDYSRTTYNARSYVAEKLGVKSVHVDVNKNENRDYYFKYLLPLLEKGYGVMIGVANHFVRLQGVNDEGLVVDDPYGHVDLKCRDKNNRDCYGYSNSLKVQNSGTANSDNNGTFGQDNLWKWEDVESIKLINYEYYYFGR